MKIQGVFFKFIFISIAVFISSCASDKREMPQPEPAPDTTIVILNNCDTTDPVTYTNLVKSILETNCTYSNCHASDAPPGFDYSTYAAIKAKVNSGIFQLRVLNLKDMPQPGSPGPDELDSCTLLKLQKWANNGAPE